MLIIYVLILALAAIAHARALSFGFVFMDDKSLIIDNELFLKAPWSALKAFTQSVWQGSHVPDAYYRPLIPASFAMDYRIGGLEPWAYHLSNWVFHAVASILVFELLRRFWGRKGLAAIGAALFAVHPLAVPPVAWIAGRNDPMLAIFAIASLIALWDGKRAWHSAMFLLALLCKESAVGIPLLAALLARHRGRKWKAIALELAPGWAVALAVYAALRANAVHEAPAIGWKELLGSARLAVAQLPIFLGKSALPWNLSPLPVFNAADFATGVSAMAAVAAIALGGQERSRRTSFWPVFGLAWFAVFLLPTALRSDTTWSTFILREDRGYLPLVGLLIAFLGMPRVAEALTRGDRPSRLGYAAVALLLTRSLAYAGDYQDAIHYWGSAAEGSPGLAIAHVHLGDEYLRTGDFPRASEEYRLALELNPTESQAHNNLGVLFLRTNQLEEAKSEFSRELALYPHHSFSIFNMGLVNRKLGKREEAKGWFRRAIEVNPDEIDAYEQLVLADIESGQLGEAKSLVDALEHKGLAIPPEIRKAVAGK